MLRTRPFAVVEGSVYLREYKYAEVEDWSYGRCATRSFARGEFEVFGEILVDTVNYR